MQRNRLTVRGTEALMFLCLGGVWLWVGCVELFRTAPMYQKNALPGYEMLQSLYPADLYIASGLTLLVVGAWLCKTRTHLRAPRERAEGCQT